VYSDVISCIIGYWLWKWSVLVERNIYIAVSVAFLKYSHLERFVVFSFTHVLLPSECYFW